jgi:hypothetical protein
MRRKQQAAKISMVAIEAIVIPIGQTIWSNTGFASLYHLFDTIGINHGKILKILTYFKNHIGIKRSCRFIYRSLHQSS